MKYMTSSTESMCISSNITQQGSSLIRFDVMW